MGMSIEPRVSSSSAGRSFSSYIVTPSDQAVTSWEKEVFTTLRQGLLVRKPGPALKEVLQPRGYGIRIGLMRRENMEPLITLGKFVLAATSSKFTCNTLESREPCAPVLGPVGKEGMEEHQSLCSGSRCFWGRC